jgi:hypothetical protein
LFKNRTLLNQIVRKFGTKDSGFTHPRKFYEDAIGIIATGKKHSEIIQENEEKSRLLVPANLTHFAIVRLGY